MLRAVRRGFWRGRYELERDGRRLAEVELRSRELTLLQEDGAWTFARESWWRSIWRLRDCEGQVHCVLRRRWTRWEAGIGERRLVIRPRGITGRRATICTDDGRRLGELVFDRRGGTLELPESVPLPLQAFLLVVPAECRRRAAALAGG